MKKFLTLGMIAITLFLNGCATSNTANTADNDEAYRSEEPVTNSKLNRRYARMDRKLSRNDEAKRRDHKRLAEEKRQEIIEVLTPAQQETLQALAKKGRFSLDQIFGK